MRLILPRKVGLNETEDCTADHRRPGTQEAAGERIQRSDR